MKISKRYGHRVHNRYTEDLGLIETTWFRIINDKEYVFNVMDWPHRKTVTVWVLKDVPDGNFHRITFRKK